MVTDTQDMSHNPLVYIRPYTMAVIYNVEMTAVHSLSYIVKALWISQQDYKSAT